MRSAGFAGFQESTTGPTHREAHLIQVSLRLVSLITLDFHSAFLQGTPSPAVRFQRLDQPGKIIKFARQVEHGGYGLAAAS
ncbi:MAG: hypothetical protein O7A08_00465 [SAR324 cluster bacterium]|nr:hypothetical protein [SAR324 cluster bacterium]